MMISTVTTQATIPADRFVLRPLRRSDAGLIAHYCADIRVAEGTRTIPHPFPPGAAEAMVERAQEPDRPEDVWALDGTSHGQDELLGLVTLARMDRDQSEISYWISPAYWQTGLASEAVAALVAANPHGSRHIFAAVFQNAPGSARVLTNCGFDYLGDAEAWCVAKEAVLPTWTYSLQTAG